MSTDKFVIIFFIKFLASSSSSLDSINSFVGFIEHILQPRKSAVANHCLTLDHEIGEKTLVKEVTSTIELNAWESYFIANSQDSMNEGEAPIRSNLFYLAKRKT